MKLAVVQMLNINELFPISGDFCRLLVTFASGLDPDQARQNVRSRLDPDCLTF